MDTGKFAAFCTRKENFVYQGEHLLRTPKNSPTLKLASDLLAEGRAAERSTMKLHARLWLTAAAALISANLMRGDDLMELKKQMRALQQQLSELREKIDAVTSGTETASAAPSENLQLSPIANRVVVGSEKSTKHSFFERKPGDSLTFYTLNGEITPYGNLDLSVDAVTKGLGGKIGPDGTGPVGITGWMGDISSNISYAGIRGFERLPGLPAIRLVYQLESQIDVSSMPGSAETNSSQSNVVKGALTSRNSYIGLSSKLGALKIGKTDAPYKNSTMRMNPFYGMLGDYQVIMSNTGGDNRVEFGTRLDHSIWYESPNWGGFAVATLYSPGQNRAVNSDNIAAGESDCTGGNIPGSGGITPVTCSDGSFSDAVSASLTYTRKTLYVASAYERHRKVNRQSDITGLYSAPNSTSQLLEAEDVADEDAAKIGAQYIFKSGTTVNGIFETMHRYVSPDLQFQNERQRNGTWFAISQQLTRKTNINLGWAHAFRAPGDPGQHNSSLVTPPGGSPGNDFTGGAHANNQANMFAFAYKYQATRNLGLYTSWAMTANSAYAHYDLGAGGRTVATDCHDASDVTGGLVASNPHCWAGGNLMGASLGMNWKF